MQAVDFSALHQYSDDRDIVSLVREFSGDLRDGCITQPGKFEGEPIHTVYFWGWLLQGEGDTTYEPCEHDGQDVDCDCDAEADFTVFHVGAGDEEAFPVTLAGAAGRDIAVREDSQGFVHSWLLADNSVATDVPDCHGPTWYDGSCKHPIHG